MTDEERDIFCELCHKLIVVNDEIILGSKDNLHELPGTVTSDNIVFMHIDCYKKLLEQENNKEKVD